MRPDRPRVFVAIGIVIEHGRALITRRPDHVPLGGLWEFPGGKQHPGETPEAAAVRELKEELSLDVVPTARLAVIEYDYAHAHVTLTPVLCRRTIATNPIASTPYRWVPLTDLTHYAFPLANAPLLHALAAGIATAAPTR